MTRLNCSVGNCLNNKEGACCRPTIYVSGEHAQRSVETCCSSFENAEYGGLTNSVGIREPNFTAQISCEVENCVHCQDKSCCASEIEVQGHGAAHRTQTQCSSFYER